MEETPLIPPVKTGYIPEDQQSPPQTGAPAFDVRTDLAVEETNGPKRASSMSGVSISEHTEKGAQIRVTRVVIENEIGAVALHKPMGTYITLEARRMNENNGSYHREISRCLARQLCSLIDTLNFQKPPTVLAVGLGNDDVTPDALGPMVLDNLFINRHLRTGRFKLPDIRDNSACICGIVPGVMAQTGMETAEIVRALVYQIKPDLIIAIDALAARSVTRLGTTIQISDTGIQPGSGVGNHRHALTRQSLGIPVIAVGVPTVVGAAAIVTDTLDTLIDVLKRETDTEDFASVLSAMSTDERYALIRELLEPRFGPMFVTPKDVDETVKRLSYTISEGINIAFFGEQENNPG